MPVSGLQSLLDGLSRAVEGTPALALGAALAWGVLSVLLSPCHLASIPLIVGFIAGQADMTARRAFVVAGAFGLGMLATIAAIGAITTALGRMAGDLGGWANYAIAAVFFGAGLHLLDLFQLPLAAPSRVAMQQRGVMAALVLGLVFGVALGPCTFAFMAPVLAASFRTGAHSTLIGCGMLVAYGLGHCGVIVAAGTSAQAVQRYLDWTSGSRGLDRLRKACGVLVLAGGLYMLYTAR